MSLPKETADLCDAVEAHIKALEARIATLEAEEARLLTEITTLRGRVELEQSARVEAERLAQQRGKVNDGLTLKIAQLEDALKAAQGGSQ